MKKALAILAVIAFAAAEVHAATVSYTGGLYSQNFDSMGSTGTTTPDGWYVGTGTGSANTGTAVVAGTGSSNVSGNYNFGVAGTNSVEDRALGALAASSTQRDTEVDITNNTGASLIALTISYDGEQWRSGGTGQVTNTLTLQLSLDGTNWVNLGSAFNFTSPQIGQAAGLLDGNAAANRAAGIGGTYDTSATPILAGSTFYLRWADPDDGGSDAGIAIDNFTLSATVVPESGTWVILLIGLGTLIGLQRQRRHARG